MQYEPPPQVTEFKWIWNKWLHGLWRSFEDTIPSGSEPGVAFRTRQLLQDSSEALDTNATATGAVSVDIENGNVHSLTLTGNVTLSFDNPSESGEFCKLILFIAQDSTGGRTVTLPASVQWAGGIAPTLTTTALAVNVITFYTFTEGSVWYGSLYGDDFS